MEEPKILPYLEITTNRGIFIPNAAARYLYPPVTSEHKCEHWIAWESTILSPLIIHIAGNTKSDTIKTSLNSCLKYLNENVKDRIPLVDVIKIHCSSILIYFNLLLLCRMQYKFVI